MTDSLDNPVQLEVAPERSALALKAAKWRDENPDKWKAIRHRYYLKHKDKIRAANTKYFDTEKRRAYMKEWRASNKDKIRGYKSTPTAKAKVKQRKAILKLQRQADESKIEIKPPHTYDINTNYCQCFPCEFHLISAMSKMVYCGKPAIGIMKTRCIRQENAGTPCCVEHSIHAKSEQRFEPLKQT